jgi:yecA family protein
MGATPFTGADFAELDAWLAEEGWPPGHMDAAMLEGYLIALLAWPIELSAGAWLPPIWGIRGWKVAAKIATPEAYEKFLVLVIGFLRELEHRLTALPPLAPFVLDSNGSIRSARYFAGAAWATGFMIALHENSAALGSRSANARSAVEGIARFASLRSAKPAAMASVSAELNAELGKLMGERASLLQLGPLSPGLSGGARGGKPRHIPVETIKLAGKIAPGATKRASRQTALPFHGPSAVPAGGVNRPKGHRLDRLFELGRRSLPLNEPANPAHFNRPKISA